MNLLADESVDRQIVDRLRREGHAVRYVAEMEPGIPDDIVRSCCSYSPGGVQEGLWVEQPTGPLALSFRRCANAESSAAGVPLVQCA